MQRSIFLSTFLFAAVLSPITLQGYNCAPPPTAKLSVLELRVGDFHGENIIEGFNSNVFSYEARFPESESVGVLWVKTNHPSTMIDVEYDGMPVRLIGQSLAELDVPLGQSELTIVVTRRGATPDTNTYVVHIERVPVFACTEQGIRDAIARGGGPNYFDCDGPTVVPTEAEIVIDNDAILDAEGNMIVDAGSVPPLAAGEVVPKVNGEHRVFSIPEGVTAELIGFTVTGGSTPGDGGGILNQGTFTLRSSTVTANSADRGGGVASLPPGTLTVVASTVSGNSANLAAGLGTAGPAEVTDTTVSGNTALVAGGGVGVATGGSLTMTGSVVEGNSTPGVAGGVGVEGQGTATLNDTSVLRNQAGEVGGGISNGGMLTLNESDVSENSATAFNGGISNEVGGVLTLNSSTVLGNSANFSGGIGNNGTVTLSNSTVSGNTATEFGGGIASNTELTLIDSTVSDNSCGFDGGGIASFSGTTTLNNTVVSGNEAGNLGGGIVIGTDSELSATNTTVSGNQTGGGGGGVLNAGTTTMNGGTLADNNADSGGGIMNWGSLTLADSTVSGNASVQGGAGLSNYLGAIATLTNTTVFDNSAGTSGGGVFNDGTLTINQGTVSSNNAGVEGGGILNEGTLSLISSAVRGNHADVGGGVRNRDIGMFTVADSNILNNTAIRFGGGIHNRGQMEVADSVVSGNEADLGSGGVSNFPELAIMTLTRTTVSENLTRRSGGGIGNAGTATLNETTVSLNTAGADGGGILNNDGTLIIMRSTIAGNTAGADGGGIENYSGSIEIDSSSVSGNSTMAGGGGAIENPFPDGTLTLINTTVSGNSSIGRGAIENAGSAVVIASTLSLNVADGTVLWDVCPLAPSCPPGALTVRNTIIDGSCMGATAVHSLGGNIEVEGNTCGLDHPMDRVWFPAPALNLLPLEDNGGPTRTRALGAGSDAVDWIDPIECVDAAGLPLTTDQRGLPRPVAILEPEPKCDVGAFEVQDGTGGTGGSGGTGGTGATGGTGGVAEIPLPMVVDDNFTGRSAFGGPPDGPPLHTEDDECSQRAGEQAGDCHRFTWDGTKEGETGDFFTGTFWTDGYGFTDLNALPVEAGATDVQFYAWGAAGGEQILFGAGLSGSAPNPPWDGAEDRKTIILTSTPTMYSVALTNLAGYTYVYGPFLWAANNVENPGGFEFYVDDIQWVTDGGAPPPEYAQDFESLNQADPDALSNDGWLAYGRVFAGDGVLKFSYGPFEAPNAAVNPTVTFFSAVVRGEGGPGQGAQQLSIYNDYNCCTNNEGHFNDTDRVESSVFQQRPIPADEVGKIVMFSFDARRGNINDPANPECAPPNTCDSTALAFIRTVDPSAGNAATNFVTEDATNLPNTWTRFTISLEIDPGLEGQILQFGFLNTASSFEPSGVYYDNIVASLETP